MNWKGTLSTIAGVLVLVLQIINLILSSDIDLTLGRKAVIMEQKADQLQTLVQGLKPSPTPK